MIGGTEASVAGGAAGAGAAGTGLTGVVSKILPILQTGGQIVHMLGPQSPFVTGDVSGMVQGMTSIGSNVDSLFKPSPGASAVKADPAILGRGTIESFQQLPKDIQDEIIRVLMRKG